MRLTLSSAAAPGATLAELLAAAARRGFAAVELVDGHAHGVHRGLTAPAVADIARTAAEAGAPIVAFRTGDVALPGLESLARLAAALDAPIVASGPAVSQDDWAALAAPRFTDAGADLLLETDGSEAEVLRAKRLAAGQGGVIGVAWEIDPATAGLDGTASVLAVADGLIRHIRLRGGGPESMAQAGQGIGTLMSALALNGYNGPLALAPSTDRYRLAWSAWLGRRGGWGCGAKEHERELATLSSRDGEEA